MGNILDYLLGPKCEGCGGRSANIRICNLCYPHNFKIIRDVDRHYNSEGRCRLCGNEETTNSHRFCYKCVPPHPDDTHLMDDSHSIFYTNNWWTRAINQGGYEERNSIIKIINCPHCSSLLKMTISRERESIKPLITDYSYYKIGDKHPLKTAFYCPVIKQEEILKRQKVCDHSYLTIYVPLNKPYEANYSDIIHNDAIKEILNNNPEEYKWLANEMTRSRSIVLWCWKCGLHYVKDS